MRSLVAEIAFLSSRVGRLSITTARPITSPVDTNRLLRVLVGTVASIAALAVAGWGISTLWTYQRYVSSLGPFTSQFAWRSLAMGAAEVVVAGGLIYLAIRCFSTKASGRFQLVSR
jgi:hypothetical protein